ncbi:GFA family protein [Chelativorans sp. EGI FJ00035]|uniref:GFA family protein n=2 Tax=Chelativorans salis TaxID=2978478 RepID=A0ABT2LMI7_9HYPH|nr:GFA family protein [Chelativorans sp. EGI FJ00035]
MARIATCTCGSLRATCVGEPEKVSLCHCFACQRRTGSTFGIAAFFRREDVRVEGPARCYTRPSDSGFPVDFHFCPDCGSTVWWEPQRKPAMIAVAVGSFADPAFPAPTQAVYAECGHPWVRDSVG